MIKSEIIVLVALVILVGCEAETDESEVDISELSPSTAAFLHTEVVAAESSSTVEIEVIRETLGEISPIPVTFTGTSTSDDYRIISGVPVRFQNRSLTTTIELEVLEDNIKEGGESIILELGDPTTGSIDRTANRFFLGITGNTSFLNDTGVMRPITSAPTAGQDSMIGLDVNSTDEDGQNGLVLTALDNAGNPVNAPALCVRDEVTGNTWTSPQVSTDIPYPLVNRMNTTNLYTWYEPDDSLNGGSKGSRTAQGLPAPWPVNDRCAYPVTSDARSATLHCDTHSIVQEFNDFGVCSYRNWRLPNALELISIVDFDPVAESQFSVINYRPFRAALEAREIDPSNVSEEDQDYFDIEMESIIVDITQSSYPPFDPTYWPAITPGTYATSTPTADGTASIICVNYDGITTTVQRCNKQEATLKVLLTRTAQEDQTETF